MNFTFYAIIDGKTGGICSLKHSEHESLKAIFHSKEEADRAVNKNGSPDLFVKTVNIVDVEKK